MAFNPNASQLSEEQIIQQVFDPANNALRTDAFVQVDTINAELTVDIKAASGDDISIASQDGTKHLDVNSDGSINVDIKNTLITEPFDYISATYPTATREIYTYKFGGAGGTLVGTITVDYTDALKEFITTVVKT